MFQGSQLLLARCIWLAAFVVVPAQADVGIFTVGNGTDCPYRDIQAAVDAAAARPGPDYVWIVDDHTYTGEQVLISDADTVVIEGGFSTCDIPTPDSFSTVSGAGNGGGAVFTIRGAVNVAFQNLLITGAARDGDASGGGIDFDGVGSLQLITTTIAFNSAGYGAGINMKGGASGATLTVSHDTAVLQNSASTSGGGIRIEGNTVLSVLEPNTLVSLNHAPNGYGGGIEVLGPAEADIGGSGPFGGAVISGNDAQYGGGIAAIAINDMEDPLVRLFTGDPANPVRVGGNLASATGGGVYLKPREATPNHTNAILCARDFRITDNAAQEGSAIYADEDSSFDPLETFYFGADVSLNTDPPLWFRGRPQHPCGPVPPAPVCATGVACNEIRDNIAEDTSGQPTPGSAVLIQTDGHLFADRVSLRGNTGAHVLRLVDTDAAEISNCLVAENVTDELIYASLGDGDDDSTNDFVFDRCTLAGNTVSTPFVMSMNANSVTIRNSIIDQPGTQVIDFQGSPGGLTAQYVLATSLSTLGSGIGLVDGEPTFVDAASGDYHLERTSLGVDFAPTQGGVDLDGEPRTIDLPDIANHFGPMDLGAYEVQVGGVLTCARTDTVYCDGFDG